VARMTRDRPLDTGAGPSFSGDDPVRPGCRDSFRGGWRWRRIVGRRRGSAGLSPAVGDTATSVSNPRVPRWSEAFAIRGCRGTLVSMDAKRVIDEALRLPADIRAALAGELLASLDDSELEADRDAAWSTEIRDRIEAYERGDVTAVPVEQALAQIRAVRGKAT
jgi:putative addiction module component (TIGR02574 family)